MTSAADFADGPPDGLDAEEWRVVMHYLAPDATALDTVTVLPRGGGGRGGGAPSLEVGGEAWRRGVRDAAQRCFPDLAPARALHRFNVILGRPHARAAVDAWREAEAVDVGHHRAALRAQALALLDVPPPACETAGDLAKWQLAQVATMRFLAELDGHFFAAREQAADRRALRAEAVRSGGAGQAALEAEAKIAEALAAKLAAASG